MEILLHPRTCSKDFIHINSFNPYNANYPHCIDEEIEIQKSTFRAFA